MTGIRSHARLSAVRAARHDEAGGSSTQSGANYVGLLLCVTQSEVEIPAVCCSLYSSARADRHGLNQEPRDSVRERSWCSPRHRETAGGEVLICRTLSLSNLGGSQRCWPEGSKVEGAPKPVCGAQCRAGSCPAQYGVALHGETRRAARIGRSLRNAVEVERIGRGVSDVHQAVGSTVRRCQLGSSEAASGVDHGRIDIALSKVLVSALLRSVESRETG